MNSSPGKSYTSMDGTPSKCRIPRPTGNKTIIRRSLSLNSSQENLMAVNRDFSKTPSLINSGHAFSHFDLKSLTSRMNFANGYFHSYPAGSMTPSPVKYPLRQNSLCEQDLASSRFGLPLDTILINNCYNQNIGSKKNVLHCQFHEKHEEYLTPTQRFTREIRHLKVLLMKANRELESKINEITKLKNELQSLKPVDGFSLYKDNGSDHCESTASVSKSSDSGSVMTQPVESTEDCVEGNDIQKSYEDLRKTRNIVPEETSNFIDEKNIPNGELKYTANTELMDCRIKLEKANSRICDLEAEVNLLKEGYETQEKEHYQMYLEMYKKGQEVARCVHADEVLEFAHNAPNRVCVPELLQQLHLTEHELDQMKNLYRHDVYTKHLTDFQDAEVTLRFLKDAIYYFLTDKDNKRHLQAIKSIIGFSELEKMNIDKAHSLWNKIVK